MVRIIARISANSESMSELRQILMALVPPSRAEPGCIGYELFQDDDSRLDFVTIETWADSAAADAHLASPHVAAAIARASPLLAQAPLIHRYTQLV